MGTRSEDASLVIKTERGHNLGRVIISKSAEAKTGIPEGTLADMQRKRVLKSLLNSELQAITPSLAGRF